MADRSSHIAPAHSVGKLSGFDLCYWIDFH